MGRRGCRDCRFSVPVYIGDGDELMNCCVYILRMGRRRPCPPGEACTVRETAGMDTYPVKMAENR